jgi:hypothetical protein
MKKRLWVSYNWYTGRLYFAYMEIEPWISA